MIIICSLIRSGQRWMSPGPRGSFLNKSISIVIFCIMSVVLVVRMQVDYLQQVVLVRFPENSSDIIPSFCGAILTEVRT